MTEENTVEMEFRRVWNDNNLLTAHRNVLNWFFFLWGVDF